MTWIRDLKVPRGTLNRAMQTIPGFLRIEQSSIPNAGDGVFARKDLPNRWIFGPYKGEMKQSENGDYSWRVSRVSDSIVCFIFIR